MIHILAPDCETDFIKACEYDEIIGARMVTLLRCYGYDADFCRLYLAQDEGGSPTAAISLFDGWLVVSANRHVDLDELAAFARAIGGYKYIEASPFIAKSLMSNILGKYDESHMMLYNRDLGAVRENISGICENPALLEVYDVVAAANPWVASTTNRDAWYTHCSHLTRHNLGFAAGIYEDGRLISTGGVFTASDNVAVISCIATLHEYRGKGHAAIITKYLINKILSKGKTPALFCASDKLADYYTRFGFMRAGKWGEIII